MLVLIKLPVPVPPNNVVVVVVVSPVMKVLLFNGSSSFCEVSERTDDQLMPPRSTSSTIAPSTLDIDGVVVTAAAVVVDRVAEILGIESVVDDMWLW